MDEYLDQKYLLEEKRRVLRQQLQEVEDEIRETQAAYSAIYTPILNLPVEITSLIFKYAQLPRMEGEEEEGEIPVEIVVSQVCHRWRSICLGFPMLWTTFYYHHCESHPDVPLDRFDVYMDRSTPLPLRIWLNLQVRNFSDCAVLQRAVKHVDRWQHFTIIWSDYLKVIEPLYEPLYQLCDLSAPLLECLTIIGPVDEEDGDPSSMGNIGVPDILTKGAPRLTYLRTTMHHLPPLSNITILRLDCGSPDGIFDRLGVERLVWLLSLPALNQLSLSGDFDDAKSIKDLPIIQMPNLKRFRVSYSNSIWGLLLCIRAPQLDSLILHMCDYPYSLNPSQDPSYAFPALRKLYVIECCATPLMVLAFTHLTAEASDILISSRHIKTIFLRMILDGGYANIVWPRLRTLSLNIYDLMGSDVCKEFATWRRRKSFTYRIHPAIFERWEAGLEALKAVSLVELDKKGWELDEPFWPQEACSAKLRYGFGQDDGFAGAITPYFD